MLRTYTARQFLDWILCCDPNWDVFMNAPVLVYDYEYGKHSCSCLAMILDFYRHLIFLEGGLKDIYDPIPDHYCKWKFTVEFTDAGVIITRTKADDD